MDAHRQMDLRTVLLTPCLFCTPWDMIRSEKGLTDRRQRPYMAKDGNAAQAGRQVHTLSSFSRRRTPVQSTSGRALLLPFELAPFVMAPLPLPLPLPFAPFPLACLSKHVRSPPRDCFY